MTMKMRHLEVSFEDGRGAIYDVFQRDAPESVTLITSRAGAMRGNHVHDASTQHVLVISGQMWAYHQVGGGPVERALLAAGDLVVHAPGEAHAYVAVDDVTFLVFAEGQRRGVDYELDTRRVPSLVEAWERQHAEP